MKVGDWRDVRYSWTTCDLSDQSEPMRMFVLRKIDELVVSMRSGMAALTWDLYTSRVVMRDAMRRGLIHRV